MLATTSKLEAALEELTEFLYLLPTGVIRFDGTGHIEMMNPAAARMLLPLCPPRDLDNAYACLRPFAPDLQGKVACFGAEHGVILASQRLDSSGGGCPVVLSLSVHRVRSGVHMAVLEDITQLVEQERLIHEQRARLASIFDHVRDYAFYTLDSGGRIDEWNASLRRMGGWEAKEVVGRDLDVFDPPEGGPHEVRHLLGRAILDGSAEAEGWRQRRDGSLWWCNTVITPLPDRYGQVRGFAVVDRDLSLRKRMEDGLRRLALSDPLTGLANRRGGEQALEAALAQSQETGGPVSVLLLDLDRFKALNDTYGHEGGDAVLRAAAEACSAVVRATDTVARWGGEEFLVVLPGTPGAEAVVVAERIREAIRRLRIGVVGATASVTVSIGVATAAEDAPDAFLRRADAALYEAKEAGRDRVVVAQSPATTAE
jgi:diguanylate cyclase (GGDEF)-like protein/PAS domain S-box-containing protein